MRQTLIHYVWLADQKRVFADVGDVTLLIERYAHQDDVSADEGEVLRKIIDDLEKGHRDTLAAAGRRP